MNPFILFQKNFLIHFCTEHTLRILASITCGTCVHMDIWLLIRDRQKTTLLISFESDMPRRPPIGGPLGICIKCSNYCLSLHFSTWDWEEILSCLNHTISIIWLQCLSTSNIEFNMNVATPHVTTGQQRKTKTESHLTHSSMFLDALPTSPPSCIHISKFDLIYSLFHK